MNKVKRPIQVVVVGGGTAGWLSACLLAASQSQNIKVTLVESPNIATIGVGEGTWPSMRQTLRKIGLSEAQFLIECDAAFKQGSCFENWCHNQNNDRYYHPFSVPSGYPQYDFSEHWLPYQKDVSFADAFSPQGRIAEQHRAPKSLMAGDDATSLNYGYHLDAGKFATLLQKHGTQKLGVAHILATIEHVKGEQDAPIQALITHDGQIIEGDLFVDCTGFAGRLIEQHYQVGWQSIEGMHINNRALAVQVPYAETTSPIASATMSTAQSHGWIWDIGLQSRRGVGFVYSDQFIQNQEAEALLQAYLKKPYLQNQNSQKQSSQKQNSQEKNTLPQVEPRLITFDPGVRNTFWKHNCVAIGLSAGFLEPLEASAIALIETSVNFLAENLLPEPSLNQALSARYNEMMTYHWQRIIDFIKLHYVLSSRQDSDYWRAQTDRSTCSDWLQAHLAIWAHRSPNFYDFPMMMEMFPAASWRYIWYGMQRGKIEFVNPPERNLPEQTASFAQKVLLEQSQKHFGQVANQTRQLMHTLPTHRDWLTQLQKRHDSE